MYIGENKGGKGHRFYLGICRICINLFIVHVSECVLGLAPSSLTFLGKLY